VSIVSGDNNSDAFYARKELSIVGPDNTLASGLGNLQIITNNAQAANIGGSLSFGGRYATTDTRTLMWAGIKGAKENDTLGNVAAYLAFSTNSGSSITERLRINSTGVVTIGSAISFDPTTANALVVNSSGNVGIGTSSPGMKLDITGISGWQGGTTGQVAQITGASSGANGGGNLRVNSNTSQAADAGGSITLGGYYIGTANSIDFAQIIGAKENATSGNAAGYLAFATRASGSNTIERARITSAGDFISTVNGTAPSLSTNGTMVFALTSNTNLRISVRGTDGTTRVANITLA
jgi:hypothetical protein